MVNVRLKHLQLCLHMQLSVYGFYVHTTNKKIRLTGRQSFTSADEMTHLSENHLLSHQAVAACKKAPAVS